MNRELLRDAESTLVDERRPLDPEKLGALASLPDGEISSLAALAHRVRKAWCGSGVDVEGIVSAKTGGCPEDCSFCSQSSRYDTTVSATPYLSADEILKAAREAESSGASSFCLVYAMRGPNRRAMSHILEMVALVKAETRLEVNVSAGILDLEQARQLAEAGVRRYNHNIETARSFFDRIVSSHTWEERALTCATVRDAGMELCCGVLLGMGESDQQRVELACELRELDPSEVPINFLNPRPGTPLGTVSRMGAWEAIRWIAVFRLAMPGVILRYGGGREITLGDLQEMGMTAGINGLIIGNYLTTLGRSPEEDLKMLSDLAMPVEMISRLA